MLVPVVGSVLGRELLGLLRALGVDELRALFAAVHSVPPQIAVAQSDVVLADNDGSISDTRTITFTLH